MASIPQIPSALSGVKDVFESLELQQKMEAQRLAIAAEIRKATNDQMDHYRGLLGMSDSTDPFKRTLAIQGLFPNASADQIEKLVNSGRAPVMIQTQSGPQMHMVTPSDLAKIKDEQATAAKSVADLLSNKDV